MITTKKKEQVDFDKTRKIIDEYFSGLTKELNYCLFCDNNFLGVPHEQVLWVENFQIVEVTIPVKKGVNIGKKLLSVIRCIRNSFIKTSVEKKRGRKRWLKLKM